FAREVLQAIPDRPISFEVFSDEFAEMERQAREIAGWGENVYVKIPVTNTRGETAAPLVKRLSHAGVKLNVTALMPLDQVREVVAARPRVAAAARVAIFAIPLALALALRAWQALTTAGVLDWDETYYLNLAVTGAAGRGLYPYLVGYGPMPILGGIGYAAYA